MATPAHICMLPDELLEKAMRFVDDGTSISNIRMTCKKFETASFSRFLELRWPVSSELRCFFADPADLQRIAGIATVEKIAQRIHSVAFTSQPRRTPDDMLYTNSLTCQEKVDLRDSISYDPPEKATFASMMQNLEAYGPHIKIEIEITNMPHRDMRLWQNITQWFSAFADCGSLRNLRRLQLCDFSCSAESLYAILRNCTNSLQDLTCFHIELEGPPGALWMTAFRTIAFCTRLEELYLGNLVETGRLGCADIRDPAGLDLPSELWLTGQNTIQETLTMHIQRGLPWDVEGFYS